VRTTANMAIYSRSWLCLAPWILFHANQTTLRRRELAAPERWMPLSEWPVQVNAKITRISLCDASRMGLPTNRHLISSSAIMTRNFLHLSGPACAALLLTACAGSGDKYPSLAVRDAERAVGQFTPTRTVASSETPARAPASAEDLAKLVTEATESHRAFIVARPNASGLVDGARGTATESDARARALIALADLTSKRSDTAIPLGDLDLLAAEARTTLAPYSEIVAARALVAGLVDQQDRTLAELWAKMQQ